MWGWITGSEGEEGEKGDTNVIKIDGIPSPGSDIEYKMLASELLGNVSKWGEEKEVDGTGKPLNGWTGISHSTEKVQLFEKTVPQLKSLTLLKAIGVVENCTIQQVLDWNLELNVEKRKIYDPDLLLLEKVKTINETLEVTRTEVNCPYPVYNREFVDMRTWIVGDDRIVFGAQSVNCEGSEHNTDCVRAKAFCGIIIDKHGEKDSKITYLGYVDPMGWVPHTVISMFRAKIADRVVTFRKLALEK